MLIKKVEFSKDDPKEHYIESYYDSSNLKKTVYFPATEVLFIYFHNLVYSYRDVNLELYEKLEKADSQGKFFISEVKKNNMKYPFYREFKLQDIERQELNEIIQEITSSDT